MRELFTGLLLACCVLPIAIGSMTVLSDFAEASAPNILRDTNSDPLWSTEVRRVNPKEQDFERLPATLTANTPVVKPKPLKRIKMLVQGVVKRADDSIQLASQLHQEKEWCGARYRSYNPADNTYQPYGGGPRQKCASPISVVTPGQIADASGTHYADAHASWCMERYSSYRIEDNTYQPFSGKRKECLGPAS